MSSLLSFVFVFIFDESEFNPGGIDASSNSGASRAFHQCSEGHSVPISRRIAYRKLLFSSMLKLLIACCAGASGACVMYTFFHEFPELQHT
jgi:hypothetical protein